jgi:hypothetical protein
MIRNTTRLQKSEEGRDIDSIRHRLDPHPVAQTLPHLWGFDPHIPIFASMVLM